MLFLYIARNLQEYFMAGIIELYYKFTVIKKNSQKIYQTIFKIIFNPDENIIKHTNYFVI